MTTIATDGVSMAADTRGEDSGNVCVIHKLTRTKYGIVGLAGDDFSGLVFLDWFVDRRGKRPEGLSDDFSAMLLSRDGIYVCNNLLRCVRVEEEFWSIGTGSAAALAAMHCGKSAAEAVEVACRVDACSAPPVDVMHLGTN